jgi:hypothetical protein
MSTLFPVNVILNSISPSSMVSQVTIYTCCASVMWEGASVPLYVTSPHCTKDVPDISVVDIHENFRGGVFISSVSILYASYLL